ncbi:MAG: TetR/AcrR family transcriptional regulator [Myxococcales bacterium]
MSAAVEIVHKSGPDALTLRTVATRLGVSQMAPYRHFTTKGALLAAVAVDGFQSLQAELMRAARRAGDGAVARYQAVATTYVRFALSHPAHFKVMYGPRPEEFRSGPVAEVTRAVFGYFRGTIVACIEAGYSTAKSPTAVAVDAWAYVHGLVILYFGGQLPTRIHRTQLVAMARKIDVFLNNRVD